MKLFKLVETKYNLYTQSIRNYLAKTLANYNTSYGSNTVFGQLINVLGSVVQNMMLYIEDSLVEQNKYTAQRKKSVYGLASLSGYQPSLGRATGVQLKINFTPSNESNLNIVLNNKTGLTCTQNGLVYHIILPQEAIIFSIERDNVTKHLYAVQGRFETQSFVVRGGKLYTQHFDFVGNMDVEYLEVWVNDEKWERVEGLYDMMPDAKQYTTRVSPIGGMELVFGNDRHGRSLEMDDVVRISYLLHDGEAGNIDVNTDTYFLFNENLQDIGGNEVDGNRVFNVTFATSDAVTSGSNSETISQVRNMIGLNSRSLVLADPNNYKSFINRFSFCGYNRTWTEKGSMVVNSMIIKNYKMLLNNGQDYFNLKENDFLLTKNQKQSIIECIENSGHQLAGVSYNIFDPQLCKYALYIYIKLKYEVGDKEYINNRIKNLIGEFFSEVQSDVFIPKSDIVNLIKNNINEVDGVDVYILSEMNEKAIQTGMYSNVEYKFDPSTGMYRKRVEKVKVYKGENPNLGLDAHGNIYLKSDEQFPVLMGGWDFLNSEGQEVTVVDPVTITYN